MLQTIFDTESFAFVQKPVPCEGDCIRFDFARNDGTRHVHCTVKIDGDSPCNALILAEENGLLCSECKEDTCEDCTVRNTPTGKPMCRNCYDEAISKVDADARMDRALTDAEQALTIYVECLREERSASKIRSSVSGLHKIEDLMALINREMVPNILRADGKQQSLLAGEAA